MKKMLPPQLKKSIRQAIRSLNRSRVVVPKQLVSGLCPLPDFLVVGAMKSGTSSLYHNICEHPSVAPAIVKEVRFFTEQYDKKSIHWYRAHFPVRRKQERLPLTGEATPSYIFNPQVARRVQALIPKVRLIVILRNPIDRAYSHYNHFMRRGFETRSFEEVIENEEREEENLQRELKKMLEDDTYHSERYFRDGYLLARGRYVEQLKRYENYFPSEQMLILKTEDFYADPSSVLRRVYAFLGLPDWNIARPQKYMVGRYSGMNPATREYLSNYFRPYNEGLYDFLGVDLGWE